METQIVNLAVTVKAPVEMKPERVAELISMCINIGMNDAAESVENDDLDETWDAQDALSLSDTNVKAVFFAG